MGGKIMSDEQEQIDLLNNRLRKTQERVKHLEEEFCAVPTKRVIFYLKDEMGDCWEVINPEDYNLENLKLVKTEVHHYYE